MYQSVRLPFGYILYRAKAVPPLGERHFCFVEGGNPMNVNVVFHIDESAKWELMLKNASHLLQVADTPGSDIRIVANAEAVRELVPQSAGSALPAMQELAERGVHFAACNLSLNSFGIRPQELVPFAEVVPAGVLELALRQREGYAYIKP